MPQVERSLLQNTNDLAYYLYCILLRCGTIYRVKVPGETYCDLLYPIGTIVACTPTEILDPSGDIV